MPKYTPDRNDIVEVDSELAVGKKGGQDKVVLVLSSIDYNRSTGLMICCPISSSACNHLVEVEVSYLGATRVVLSHIVTTLDWRTRNIRKLSMTTKAETVEVVSRLAALIGVYSED